MAALGHSTRSFNFGLSSMTVGEGLYILRRILALRPGRLRWLMLEEDLNGHTDPENLHTRRTIEWHTPSITARSLLATLRTPFPFDRRVDAAWEDVRASFQRALGMGAAAERLHGLIDDEGGLGEEGFLALRNARDGTIGSIIHRVKEYNAKLAQFRAIPADLNEDGPYRALLFNDILALAREHGLTTIMVRAPALWRPPMPKVNAPMFTFNDPERFPELYSPAVRFDMNHLNGTGALLYSRMLARSFAEYLDAIR